MLKKLLMPGELDGLQALDQFFPWFKLVIMINLMLNISISLQHLSKLNIKLRNKEDKMIMMLKKLKINGELDILQALEVHKNTEDWFKDLTQLLVIIMLIDLKV